MCSLLDIDPLARGRVPRSKVPYPTDTHRFNPKRRWEEGSWWNYSVIGGTCVWGQRDHKTTTITTFRRFGPVALRLHGNENAPKQAWAQHERCELDLKQSRGGDEGEKAASTGMQPIPLSHIPALLRNQLHSKFMCPTVNHNINSKGRFISSLAPKVPYWHTSATWHLCCKLVPLSIGVCMLMRAGGLQQQSQAPAAWSEITLWGAAGSQAVCLLQLTSHQPPHCR